MNNPARRLLALALVILLGLASPGIIGTAAANAPSCGSVTYTGDGSDSNPYEVANVDQLQCIGENHGNATSQSDALSSDYELTSDIDASGTSSWNGGAGFDPIETSGTKFTGTFDGAGYTVSDLSINRPNTDEVGLFGEIGDGSTVKDITLDSPDVTGGQRTGPLVGWIHGTGTVTRGAVSGGTVTTGHSGDAEVGGLVGTISDGTVELSNSSATVDGASQDEIGGLVGDNAGTVKQSYATGTVKNGGDRVGGLVGDVNSGYTIENVYAAGSVSGSSNVGGLLGYDGGATITDAYYDTSPSGTGQSSSAGGTGLTTSEMQGSSAESNMNFDWKNTWQAVPGEYPVLVWGAEAAGALIPTINETETPVTEGETLTVVATVTNYDSNSQTQDVTLTADGTVVDTRSDLTVAGGNSKQVTLEWETATDSADYYDIAVATDDAVNTASQRVTIYDQHDWPRLGFDQTSTGHNPNTTGPVSGVKKSWSFSTGNNVVSSPAVVNNTVYVGSKDSNVYALNASDGSKQWSYSTGEEIFAKPAVVNNTVYIGSDDDKLYALNASDGTKRWAYATSGDVQGAPAVVNGTVYFGSKDKNVYAVDASDGTKRWAYATSGIVQSSAAVANNTVYIGSNDNSVYALNATDGSKRWSYTTGNIVIAPPAVVDNTVYVGSWDDNLYALNASDGTKRWSYDTGGRMNGGPAVVNDTVYVGARDADTVYALNASDGSKQWSYSTGDDAFPSPSVVSNTVYIGSVDDTMYALNASDGSERWRYTTGGNIGSSAAVSNGTVYVGSNDNNLYALTEPLEYANGYPTTSSVGTDGFDVDVKANEGGTAYYVVLEDGATAPSVSQVKNGNDGDGTSARKNGSDAISASTEKSFTVSGLSEDTRYDVYVVVEDDAGNANKSSRIDELTNSISSDPPESSYDGGDDEEEEKSDDQKVIVEKPTDSDQSRSGDEESPEVTVRVPEPQPGDVLLLTDSEATLSADSSTDDSGTDTGGSDDGDSGGSGSSTSNVRADQMAVEVETTESFELSVTTYENDLTVNSRLGGGVVSDTEPANPVASGGALIGLPPAQATNTNGLAPQNVQTAAETFETATEEVAAGYIEVNTTLSPEEIAGATFEFSIRKSYLDQLGVAPERVELHHQTEDEWVPRETEYLSSGDIYHRFEGTMPAFSVFALGTGADVMNIDSNLSVSGTGTSDNTVSVGEAVTVSATVENRGQTSASERFKLTADGEVVATEDVSIAGGENKTVELTFTPDSTGEYTLGIGEQKVPLTVEADSGLPWWIVVIIGLGIGVFLVIWR